MAWSRRAVLTAAAACSTGTLALPRAATGAVFASNAPWNTAPGTVRAPAPGIAALSVGLSPWISDGGWSVPVWSAQPSDPLCSVLYCDNWGRVASGQWKRSHNGPAVERQILAEAQLGFPYPGNTYSSQSTTS